MPSTQSLETKSSRVFEAFMSGRSLNLFEAQRELHDRCLHSTVAQLQRLRQITIERKRETVAGYQGCPTSVCRWTKAGTFPTAIHLGASMVRWKSSQVEAWIAEREAL